MGWLLLRIHAKQHRQQTKQSLSGDVNQVTLFSDAQVDRHQGYEALREPSADSIVEGAAVRLIDMKDRIDIYAGNTPIGQLSASQAQLMRDQQRLAERKGRSVQGRISQVSKLTNTFTVEVVDI